MIGAASDIAGVLPREGGLARILLDALPSNVALVDASGTIVAVNAAWEKFGAENGGAVGVGADYLGVCDAAAAAGIDHAREAAQLVRAALAGDARPLRTTYPCHSPDAERWFELRCSPLEYEGESLALVKHADVTSLVVGARAAPSDLVETLVRAGAARFQVSFNGNGPTQALHDILAPKGLGPLTPEELERVLGIADVTHHDGLPRTVRHRMRRTDGEPALWVETRIEAPKHGVLRGTLRDVGAHRVLEDELRLRAGILDAVDTAVIATDAGGVITEWNATAARMFGCSRGEALGTPSTSSASCRWTERWRPASCRPSPCAAAGRGASRWPTARAAPSRPRSVSWPSATATASRGGWWAPGSTSASGPPSSSRPPRPRRRGRQSPPPWPRAC